MVKLKVSHSSEGGQLQTSSNTVLTHHHASIQLRLGQAKHGEVVLAERIDWPQHACFSEMCVTQPSPSQQSAMQASHVKNVSRNVPVSLSEKRVKEMEAKTYNRRDSQMVTHSSTSRPVQCLCMAERTGCPVFTDLWSYVLFLK